MTVSAGVQGLMLTAAIILIGLYLLVGAAAYFYSDSIIFQPQAINFSDKSYIYKLTTPSGEKIHAKFFANEEAEFTILFSHENAEDIYTSTPFFEELSRAGFNVFAYDYRGYGISEGRPSEKNTYQDIETAYDFLVNEKKFAPEKIILHGRSLGGAVAVDLASRRKCGGLIVESSFVSAFRVMTVVPVFPFDKFASLRKIGRVNCPVLVFTRSKTPGTTIWRPSPEDVILPR
jgi:alpha-beta hydrolase superfamily lysophospholipase